MLIEFTKLSQLIINAAFNRVLLNQPTENLDNGVEIYSGCLNVMLVEFTKFNKID